jgi:predicted thioesterase
MGTPEQLRPGLRGTVTTTVGEADTALTLGSGDVPVLATPRAVALAEAATVDALRGWIDSGSTTVGTRVELEHLAATPIGHSVTAEAVLVAVDGRRLTFDVMVHDGDLAVARGAVHRIVVDRARFLANAGVPA